MANPRRYLLNPQEGHPSLPPEKIAELWRSEYPAVLVDAEEARAKGQRLIERCRYFIEQGHGSRSIEEIEREWAGVLLLEVSLSETETELVFRTIAKPNCNLELQFTVETPARKRRSIAQKAAGIPRLSSRNAGQ